MHRLVMIRSMGAYGVIYLQKIGHIIRIKDMILKLRL